MKRKAPEDSLPKSKRLRFSPSDCDCGIPSNSIYLQRNMDILGEHYLEITQELNFIHQCCNNQWDKNAPAEKGDLYHFNNLREKIAEIENEYERLQCQLCMACWKSYLNYQ